MLDTRAELDKRSLGVSYPVRAFVDAEKGYEKIRNIEDAEAQTQAEKIFDNLVKRFGTSQVKDDEIKKIWRHLFVAEHELSEHEPPRRFHAHPEVLAAWDRLRSKDYRQIKDSDVQLLKHELVELRLMAKGKSFTEAHAEAHRRFPWADTVGLRDPEGDDELRYYGAGSSTLRVRRPGPWARRPPLVTTGGRASTSSTTSRAQVRGRARSGSVRTAESGRHHRSLRRRRRRLGLCSGRRIWLMPWPRFRIRSMS